MKRVLLLTGLVIFLFSQDGFAQRKGLSFSKEAYEKVPIAEDEVLGYTDTDLPTSASHKAYAPYAGNQGDYGTCVGWSSAYGALTIEYAKKMGLKDREQITFSAFCPYYIYNQFKDEFDFFCQSGGFFEDALEIMYTKGAKRYYLPEYTCYSDYDNFSLQNANSFKINDYYRLFDWNESEFDKALGLESDRVVNLKKALANGHPVLIGMYVPGSFDYLIGKDLWTPTQEEKDNYNAQPGHAMTIVGYDDNKYGGAFEVLNSWGRDWGSDGFVWIKYDDMDLFGHTAFYMDLGYKYFASTGCQFGDCKDGYSRYKFDTGEVYEGELKDGFFDGEGMYLYSDGSGFAGTWHEGFKNGSGIMMYTNGTTLSGYWKDNIYYGTTSPGYDFETETTPVVTPPTEEEEEEFDWSEFWASFDTETEEDAVEETPTTGCISGDCDNGFGKFIYSDGDIYEGNFKSSYRHGYGTYQYIEGDRYEGMWHWSDRQGLGYYRWPSGNEYIGYWKANQQDGLGTKYYASGETDAGTWKAGVFQTDATFGFAGTNDEPASEGMPGYGTYFQRSTDGKAITPKYNQVPMKQGFGGVPTSGLGAPMEDPYQKMASKVVQDLLKGLGKTDLSNPRVNIIDSNRDVAYTSKTTGINVSTRFIDLCRSFGKDSLSALSVVLAHELGHYFKDHFFCRDFGYAYGETEWGQKISGSFDEIFETGYFETQADEFGLFFSFVAGYDPFKVAEEVIGKVYETFDLPENLKGYPPKASRQEQVRIAEQNVRKLIPLFEVGNFMAILGTLQTGKDNAILANSSLCYEHIIDQKITTAELYNNLGVNYINMALKHIEPEEFRFALPTEIDFDSRLYSITETGSGKGWGEDGWGDDGTLNYADGEVVARYLQQAISYLEMAFKIDETYSEAYNNAAAAFLLLEDYDEAWVKARKAHKYAKEYSPVIGVRNSLDLQAIIAFYNDEEDEAVELWDKAIALGSRVAEHNKAVRQTSEAALATHAGSSGSLSADVLKRPSFNDLEKIGGESLYDIGSEYVYNGKPIDTWQLKDQKAMVGKSELDGGDFFIFASMDRSRIVDSYYFYFVPGTAPKETSLKIVNGDTSAKVEAAYGTPAKVLSSATHDYYIYVRKNIIFKIDQKNKVDGWILYDINL